jgi:hypothetical protein
MSLSALGKFILPPVIAAAGVFSAMNLPLAMMGDKPVGIRYEEEPVFDGRIRDIAPPYVVFVTALSFGVGIGVAAIGGWRSSSRKSSQFQQQVFTLEGNLEQKDKLLKELKLSDSRLSVSGLNNFLDDEVPFNQPALSRALPAVVTQPVVQQPVVQDIFVSQNPDKVSPVPTLAPKPIGTRTAMATQKALYAKPQPVTSAASFASASSAQAFGRYDKSHKVEENTVATSVNEAKPTASNQDFEALQQQIKQMMEQMLLIQNNMQQMPQTASVQTSPPEKFKVYYEAPTSSETRFQ